MTRLTILCFAVPAVLGAAEGDITLDAEAQLWRPHGPHAPYAATVITSTDDITTRDLDYGYGPAFAVGASYGVAAAGRVRLGLWRADQDASADIEATTGLGITPFLPGIANFDEGASADGEVVAWTVDLAYEHDLEAGGFRIAPGIGVRWFDLDLRQEVRFRDGGGTLFQSEHQRIDGPGPRLSLAVARDLGQRFTAFGGLSYGLLLASFEDEASLSAGGATDFDAQQDEDRLVTTIDLRLGVAMRMGGNAVVSLSWTLGEWQNVLVNERFSDAGTSGPGRDLSWDALSLGLSWRIGG